MIYIIYLYASYVLCIVKHFNCDGIAVYDTLGSTVTNGKAAATTHSLEARLNLFQIIEVISDDQHCLLFGIWSTKD